MATKLYVGNLSFQTTEGDLQRMFEQAGRVVSCSIIMDKFTNKSRGFGFVEMSSQEEATKAIAEFNGKDVDGKREVGQLYNNFQSSVITRESVILILESAIRYTCNFDLLTPPFDAMKMITVGDIQSTFDNMKLTTGKRLGFRFQGDHEEIS